MAFTTGGDTRHWWVNGGWTLAGVVALAGTLLAARAAPEARVRRAWQLWAIATALWLAGTLVRDAVNLTGGPTTPTWAPTLLWQLFAVFAIWGLAVRSPPGALSFRLFVLDALPPVLVGVEAMRLASGEAMHTDVLHQELVALYPALYGLMALVAWQLLALIGLRRASPVMWLLVAGFLSTAAAAFVWVPEAPGAHHIQDSPAAVLWTVGLLALGAAGFLRAAAPEEATRIASPSRDAGLRVVLPAVAILALWGIDVLGLDPIPAVTMGLILAAFVSFAIRFYLVRWQIAGLATRDPLTGLPNRRVFDENLVQVVERAGRSRGAALLLVDLDGFKAVNDTIGHPAGDRVLVEAARLLKAAVRPGDLLARVGGDEFAVLAHDVTRPEARGVGRRLLEGLSGCRFEERGHVFTLSACLGGYVIDEPEDREAVVARADAALYRAKGAGPGAISF